MPLGCDVGRRGVARDDGEVSVPTYRYRALSPAGDVVTGSLAAPNAAEVALRIEYLGLIPLDAATEAEPSRLGGGSILATFSRPRPEDLTIFTGDLALVLRTGARIHEALELLASDSDVGRMRPTIAAVSASIVAGESFGEAIARHPHVFPALYLALVRVGEASGALVAVLETLASERQRSEVMARKLIDTLRYPAFLLLAAGGVMTFFLLFVLPQFAGVFRDFNAKLDPVLVTFLAMSDFLRAQGLGVAAGLAAFAVGLFLLWRRPGFRGRLIFAATRLPIVRPAMDAYRTALFCRNLSLLLSSGVTLSASLRILVDIMSSSGPSDRWAHVVDKVRHGGRLSEALTAAEALPAMAVRTLRLGEESGQLPTLAARVADFYETKLQRSLDRLVGFAGPVAIMFISLVVGGLIVSVMTALMSVNQMVS
jgi:general secretion pathway protein F